ncbi:MAG: N-acetyltransferase [Armatimonadetes bacterium]|nr:N-acetyltransferase [Armatimonadota bacterium]
MTLESGTVVIRRAVAADVPRLHVLISGFADRDRMLHRSLNELYENLRDFRVADRDGEVVGCCALHVFWADLAEVKSLAVAEGRQGGGIGRRLVEACVADAAALGIPRVFCLTYEADFFRRCGFHVVDRCRFPRKVWSECVRCPKFFDCTEIAMTREVAVAGAGPAAEEAVAAG